DNRAHGIHGDDYETSLMLNFAPETVKMEHAHDFASSTPKARQTFKHLAPQSPHAYAWIAGDINPDGVAGEANLATAEKGAAAAAHQAKGFVELLADVRAMKLDDWLTG
ncbi:MAG: creatininase family protein, partial [Pseudomonadota bacterium]